MEIVKKRFGQLKDGREVELFSLINDSGMEVDITNYGGIVTAIRMPDKNKEPGDVVLGFDTLEEYLGDHPYFGAIIGRYANRIAKGRFELEGETYHLVQNNGPNALHGGTLGFDKVVWTAVTEKTLDTISLKLGYESKDMEEGYPGNLMVEVEYSLNNRNELAISYRATTDKTTVINLTNHSYFNLGNCEGDILDHILMIDADEICELDEHSTPTGKILPVKDTSFDFRAAKSIAEDISGTGTDPLGYDNNYIINHHDGELQRIASVYHEKSGRSMDVLTTLPGVQLYTANYVNGVKGKGGIEYNMHSAFCLETQNFPDAPNHPHFPSAVLLPEEEYNEVTVYRFKW